MRKVLFIFSVLTDADVEWIAAAGERVHVDAGAVLIPVGPDTDLESLLLSQSERLWELIERSVAGAKRRDATRLDDLPD